MKTSRTKRPHYVLCTVHGKRKYFSKKEARRARLQIDHSMHIYRCDHDLVRGYHLGHTKPGTSREVMRARDTAVTS